MEDIPSNPNKDIQDLLMQEIPNMPPKAIKEIPKIPDLSKEIEDINPTNPIDIEISSSSSLDIEEIMNNLPSNSSCSYQKLLELLGLWHIQLGQAKAIRQPRRAIPTQQLVTKNLISQGLSKLPTGNIPSEGDKAIDLNELQVQGYSKPIRSSKNAKNTGLSKPIISEPLEPLQPLYKVKEKALTNSPKEPAS